MKFEMDDFAQVRNRNERFVLITLEDFLRSDDRGKVYHERLSGSDLQRIYAVALNYLPARYIQPTTILLNSPTRAQEVTQAVRDAFESVIHDHPPGRRTPARAKAKPKK